LGIDIHFNLLYNSYKYKYTPYKKDVKMDAITTHQPINIMPQDAKKDMKSRIGKFLAWHTGKGYQWFRPYLREYRDHLLTYLSPSSTKQHLATIRKRYAILLTDNGTRQMIYDAARIELESSEIEDTPANRKAIVDEIITQLQNDINPNNSPVDVPQKQDEFDSDHLRLTSSQASTLLSMPGLNSLEGLRDTALIAMMLCTGIREAEAASIDVDDLRHAINGELSLRVRKGKGNKERGIPYGELDWVLAIVDKWLVKANITAGPVFRGFKSRWMTIPADTALTTRSIQKILKKYAIIKDGKLINIKPHDLRRSYARLFYENGGDLVALQQNLGHKNIKTTLGYIGDMDISKRRAPAMLSFDLGQLNDTQ